MKPQLIIWSSLELIGKGIQPIQCGSLRKPRLSRQDNRIWRGSLLAASGSEVTLMLHEPLIGILKAILQ